MGTMGGESLPCAPPPHTPPSPPTRCSWHCRDYKLHPHGLAAPGDWHRAPSSVPSIQTPPPAPPGHLPPHAAPMWLAKFSQFRPHIHTCVLTHLFLLRKRKIVPEQDVGPLLDVTARCGAMALLAVQVGSLFTPAEQQGSP